MSEFYKAVRLDIKAGEKTEPVNYVGVHPLVWHDHPDQPEMGFMEIDCPHPFERVISAGALHNCTLCGENIIRKP